MSPTIRLAGDWAPRNCKVEKLPFDYAAVINLEGPVVGIGTDRYKGRPKAGPHLYNSQFPESDHGGILVTANNHFMDYGTEAARECLENIEASRWKTVGYGENREIASKPIFLELEGGVRVGILSRCEHQFGVAQFNAPGVAGFDATVYEQIRKLRSECDYVIASIHAAAEMFPWPSPMRQDSWRALIDVGAHVVHGHHAHVPQGWEAYNGGVIFYGLGNFCVDPNKWRYKPNGLWSVCPKIEFDVGKVNFEPSLMQVREISGGIAVDSLSKSEMTSKLDYLKACAEPLSNRLLLEALWQEFAIRKFTNTFSPWLGWQNIKLSAKFRRNLGAIARKLGLRKSNPNALPKHLSNLLLRYHLFACESHYSAISTALALLSEEIPDLRNSESTKLFHAHYRD